MKARPHYRLWFLAVVNVLILFHIYAYYVLGHRTVGCVDFFGLATFLGKGQITAGTLFLFALIAVTLVAGRVFCGWGCHFALFQDLSFKLLTRLGVRTSFRRSRLEYVVPPIMFAVTLIAPIAAWWRDNGLPRETTSNVSFPEVWHLLPGWKGVVLILLVDVVLLTALFGSRAFCRYVCPYGLFLKFFHFVSPMRIVKVGDCSDCGSCARSCPTGVPIKRELDSFTVIRDLNCMNCGDCVAACPTGAITLRPTTRAYKRIWHRGLTMATQPRWVEALLLGCVVVAIMLYRGREFGDFLVAGMGLVLGATITVAVAPRRFLLPGQTVKFGVRRIRITAAAFSIYLLVGLASQAVGLVALRTSDRALEDRRNDVVLKTYARVSAVSHLTRPFTFYLDDFGKRAPRRVGRISKRASEAMVAGDWPAAEQLYRAILTVEPTSLQAQGNLGTALYKQALYWEAASCYMEILEHDPHDLVALYHLAMTRIQLGELGEAARIVQDILAIDTVGNAYNLIRQNPLFRLLSSETRYRSAMALYRPRAAQAPEKVEGRP